MDRNLALEFVRVTEAAALAAAKWFGRGEKIKADGAAVEVMRSTLNDISFTGTVVIGEGEKDEAPMLYSGEQVGKATDCGSNELDLAIDPVEGTTLVAHGKPNALVVLAAAPKGSFLKAPGTYMDIIATGRHGREAIDLTKSTTDNLRSIAEALDKDISEVTVAMLERPRLEDKKEEIRQCGARLRLMEHGTVAEALATGITDSGIDILVGDSGAPEVVILAAGLRCLDGAVQARIKPHNEATQKEAEGLGLIDRILTIDDIAKGEDHMFVATGISEGSFLGGVVFTSHGAKTQSIVMRSRSKTIRFITSEHHFEHGVPKY